MTGIINDIKNWIKQYKNKCDAGYGSVEEERKLLREYGLAMLMLVLITNVIKFISPGILYKYFVLLTGAFLLCFLSSFFYRKKRNSHKWKKVKVSIYYMAVSCMMLILAPIFIFLSILSILANITNKEHLLVKYPVCFLLELAYHLCFLLVLVKETIKYNQEPISLFVCFVFVFLIDNFFVKGFRCMFLQVEHKHYEMYKYALEVDVVYEYVFLGVAVLATVISATDYELAFVPFLAWYSLKQLSNYRKEKKNSRFVNQYLINTFSCLWELDEVHLKVLEDGRMDMKSIIDISKCDHYIKFYGKSLWLERCYQRRVVSALNSIHGLCDKIYILPEQRKEAIQDIRDSLNEIAQCI